MMLGAAIKAIRNMLRREPKDVLELTHAMRVGKSTKLTPGYEKLRIRELHQALLDFKAGRAGVVKKTST